MVVENEIKSEMRSDGVGGGQSWKRIKDEKGNDWRRWEKARKSLRIEKKTLPVVAIFPGRDGTGTRWKLGC